VNDISEIDILMMRISVLFIVVVFMIASVGDARNLLNIVLNDLFGVDVLKDVDIW